MTTQNIGLFNAIGAKMRYLNQRQGVLAQNIANADTPGYKPYDLKKVDFSSYLSGGNENIPDIQPTLTNPKHLTLSGDLLAPETKVDDAFYDVEPSGNAVALEDQMIKATRNQVDYSLMSSLYQKNLNMIRTALGRAQ